VMVRASAVFSEFIVRVLLVAAAGIIVRASVVAEVRVATPVECLNQQYG
jgi:hypothetical protein